MEQSDAVLKRHYKSICNLYAVWADVGGGFGDALSSSTMMDPGEFVRFAEDMGLVEAQLITHEAAAPFSQP